MMTTMTTTDIAPQSTLVAYQVRTYGPVPIAGYGKGAEITATVRYDDRCDNGHNTFSITASVVTPRSRHENDIEAGGPLQEDIARCFPELASLLRWHLVSTDGPLHYIENTMYWLGRRGFRDARDGKSNSPPNIAHARHSACWSDMPDGYVITGTIVSNATVEEALTARLPGLLTEFRSAVELLGMTW